MLFHVNVSLISNFVKKEFKVILINLIKEKYIFINEMYLQINKINSSIIYYAKLLYLFQNFILIVYSYINYQINLFIKTTLSYIQFYIRIMSHLQSTYRENEAYIIGFSSNSNVSSKHNNLSRILELPRHCECNRVKAGISLLTTVPGFPNERKKYCELRRSTVDAF